MTDKDLSSDSQYGNQFDNDPLLEQSIEKKKTIQLKRRQAKPKVYSEWSNEDTFRLISCVERTPMLWNTMDEKYRNKSERQLAWKHMSAANFNNKFKDTELMAKWSNMRIQYRSYYTKYRKKRSREGGNITVKWKFYDAMAFISPNEEHTTKNTLNMLNADDESLDSMFDRSSTSTPKISKHRQLSHSSSTTVTSHNLATEMKAEVNHFKEQPQEREDEFDTFGKYIATELRALSDPNFARRVRFKVARCLMDCIEAEDQPVRQADVFNGSPQLLKQEDALL